jgi:molecular chaperone GrpE
MSEPQQEPTQTSEDGAAEPGAADAAAATAPFEQVQKERDDYYDRLLRKTAEFDNFRKRVERERKDFTEWAAADVLSDLLGVMDDFDRALATPAPPEAQAYKTGVELIHRARTDLVRKRGVTPIETVGADFDPHRHQAVAYDAVEGAREGEIVEELRKGYMLGDRLLRPALVKVARAS